MIRLFKIDSDAYIIAHDESRIVETLTGVITAMLLLDIHTDEVLRGLAALEKDDMAVFGVNKTFIFSKKLNKAA